MLLPLSCQHLDLSNIRGRVYASRAWTRTTLLWLISSVIAGVSDANVVNAGYLDVGEGGGVAVVVVDA